MVEAIGAVGLEERRVWRIFGANSLGRIKLGTGESHGLLRLIIGALILFTVVWGQELGHGLSNLLSRWCLLG